MGTVAPTWDDAVKVHRSWRPGLSGLVAGAVMAFVLASPASSAPPVFGLELLHRGGPVRVDKTTRFAVALQNLSDASRKSVRVCVKLPRSVAVTSVRQGKRGRDGICWSMKSVRPHQFKFLVFRARPRPSAPRVVRAPATLKSAEIQRAARITFRIRVLRR